VSPPVSSTVDTAPPVAPGHGVAISALAQFGAQALHLVLNVVSSLAVIRYLGPTVFGSYVVIVITAAFAGLVSDLGLNKLAAREIARTPHDEVHLLGSVLACRLLLAVGSFGLTVGALALMGERGEVLLAGAIYALLAFAEAALAVVIVFHVRVQQQYEALVRVVIEVLETALVLWLIVRGTSLVPLMAAPVGAAFVGVVVAVVLARRRLVAWPRLHLDRAPHLLREALPVGLTLLLAAAYLRIPALALASMRGEAEAGFYGAAYQPIEYLLLASAVVINVLLPQLARAHAVDDARFVDLYRRGTEALLAVTIPVSLGLVVAGPAIVAAVYGADYDASATPLRILGLALVPMVQSFWQSIVLLAGGEQRRTLPYNLLASGLTVVLCIVLIPDRGATGTALALLGTGLVVVVAANAASARHLGLTHDRARLTLLVGCGAVAIAGALALSANVTGPWLAVAIVLPAYAAALWRLGLLPSFALLEEPAPVQSTSAP